MKHCPKCHAEYEDRVRVCADCRIGLAPGTAPDEPENGGWSVVTTLGSDEEATLLAGFLEGNGIEVTVESISSHAIAETVGELANIRILVPAGKKNAARKLLDDRQSEFEKAGDDDEAVMTDEGVAHLDDDSELSD